MKRFFFVLAIVSLISLVGCGGGNSSSPQNVAISIAVSPTSTSVPAGATQQFTAVVTGASNTGVTWTASGAGCSGKSCGTISASGMYTAPTVVPNPASVTVQATAVADASRSASVSLTVGPAALLSLAVSPTSAFLPKGTTQQFTATGKFTDGRTADITSQVKWSSSSPNVIIDAAGLAQAAALTNGVTITAKSGSISGSTTVSVTAAALSFISVTPGATAIPFGLTQQFVATGLFTDNSTKNISASVSWTSSDILVASIDSTAIARTVGQGDALITATSGKIVGSAAFTVLPAALTSIAVSPVSVSIGINGTQQFVAKGTYTDGTTKDVSTTATWASSLSSAVNVDAAGLATAVSWNATAIPITAAVSGITSPPAMFTVLNSCATRNVDMKLLVVNNSSVNAGAGYSDFAAIQQILGYMGTPYDVLDLARVTGGITASNLSDGFCHGFYQGVIFAYGGDYSALAGKAVLDTYEKDFGVRQVNWYAYPGPDFGLSYAAVAAAPYTANFTAAASPVFSYANLGSPLAIDVTQAYTYLAKAAPAAGASVSPLLQDTTGNVVSIVYRQADGREMLTQTFDSNQYLTHSLVLAYGLINWVTKGIFLGDYHVYLTPQVDDLFIDDSEWVATTACTTPVDDPSLPTFRIAAADVDALLLWQTSKQLDPQFAKFVLHFAFNGSGATGDPNSGGFSPDDLTPKLRSVQSSFKWINHTWSHANLDAASASITNTEITRNNSRATSLGLSFYNTENLVTPDISGLNNPAFLNQAVKNGIRYLVTDTSVIGAPNNGTNPSPNVGIVNSINNLIYEVPRHPNNLFYNVNNPIDWEAEYHCIYANQPPYSTYTAQQIADDIGQGFLVNMLKGDMDPLMFHQPNLRAYDGTHSLLGDVVDSTLTKYKSLYTLPVLSPTLNELGDAMITRDNYNRSGVSATLTGIGGTTPALKVTIPATGVAATVPVTGLNSTGAEVYGGQFISHVSMTPGQTVTIAVQ